MAAEADDADPSSDRSWWRTLPGMLTATAGLISAITGLIVAVQQLRPSHASPPTGPALTSAANTQAANTQTANTFPATVPIGNSGRASSAAVRVSFPAGAHAQVGDYRYDFVGASAAAGNPGQLALAIRVKLTNGSRYDANFWNATFRLRVGSDVSAPTNSLDDLVHGGTTETAEIDFTVPASTRNATLLVGDDPSHAIAVPVALRGAHG